MTKHCVLAVVLVGLCVGCNKSGGSNPFSESPSSIVRALYMSCNAGEYSKVEPLLSSDLQKLVHGDMGTMAGGIKGICDKESNNGSIAGIDVVSEEIKGEGAMVIVNVRYKDGTMKRNDRNPCIKENGSWKIAPGD